MEKEKGGKNTHNYKRMMNDQIRNLCSHSYLLQEGHVFKIGMKPQALYLLSASRVRKASI